MNMKDQSKNKNNDSLAYRHEHLLKAFSPKQALSVALA